MTTRRRVLTFTAALLLGMLAGWWLIPQRHGGRALVLIASSDPIERQRGWGWLLPSAGANGNVGTRRVDQLLLRIEAVLIDAPDAAIRDAANVLDNIERWGWKLRDEALMLRELDARVRGDEADHRVAVARLETAPRRISAPRVLSPATALLAETNEPLAMAALEALLAWLGRDRVHLLQYDDVSRLSAPLERRYWLALAWATRNETAVPAAPVTAGEWSPDVLEAWFFHEAVRSPRESAKWIDQLMAWRDAADLPAAYLLRQCHSPAAVEALGTLIERGNAAAALARQSLDPALEREVARGMALQDDQPPWRRRLAHWRWAPEVSGPARPVLELPPADSDGSVYLAALLAERLLPAEESSALSERWLRSFDDDEKRAGAVLAALIGQHETLVREARDATTDARVRTVLRVAADALRAHHGNDLDTPSREFAWRALGAPPGDFDPDIAVCLLACGEQRVLPELTALPNALPSSEDWQRAVQRRAVLVERFAPTWHEALGRPLGGDLGGLRLHFDALDVLRVLESRSIGWQSSRQIFSPTARLASPDELTSFGGRAARSASGQ